MSQLTDLLAESERLCAACQLERQRLCAAYDMPLTVAPLEQPTAAWVAAREETERRLGVRLVKFFSHKEMIR